MANPRRTISNIFAIIAFVVIVVLTIALIQVVDLGMSYLRIRFGLAGTPNVNVVNAPIDQIPEVVEPPRTATSTDRVVIDISPKEVVSSDPFFSTDTYRNASVLVGLNGSFQYAHIKATVEGPENVDGFLSVAFGDVSGSWNTVRSSDTKLDVEATRTAGGLLSGSQTVDIDLLGKTVLSTTAKEFVTTHSPTKNIRLWDFIQPPPPSAVRIVVAPFDKNGSFATFKLTKLEFEYTCEKGSACSVVRCSNIELTTQCLLREFGKSATDEWKKHFIPSKQ